MNKRIEIVVSHNTKQNNMGTGSQRSVFSVLEQYYQHVTVTTITDTNDIDMLAKRKPDLVVLGMNHLWQDAEIPGDKPTKLSIASYLEKRNINFAGSYSQALTLQIDKSSSKQTVMNAGVNSSAFFVAPVGQNIPQHDLRFPLFVKPVDGGNSKGIDEMSVVYDEAALVSKVRSIHEELKADALVEEFLPGREFSVAVIEQVDGTIRAMPIELVTSPDSNGNSFLSRSVKKGDNERAIAVIDPILKARVSQVAIDSFKALGSRDFGRIDVRLDSQGNPSFMEANLRPGLSNHGYLSRCFYLNDQLDYKDMILSIVRLGLERSISTL